MGLSISAGDSADTVPLSWLDRAGNQNRLRTSTTLPFTDETAAYHLAQGNLRSLTTAITSQAKFWVADRRTAGLVGGIRRVAGGLPTKAMGDVFPDLRKLSPGQRHPQPVPEKTVI